MSDRTGAPGWSEPDLRPPGLGMYLIPVALALFCLVVSQANESCFWGFDENEPATWLSSVFMLSACLISLAGALRSDLPRPRRIVGGAMALIAFVALLDENLLWHETLGRKIRHSITTIPRSVTHYTDDVMILLGAIVGAFILYYSIRYVMREAGFSGRGIPLRPYLACVVVLAVIHGLLDILGHGERVVAFFWPYLAYSSQELYVDRLSYFEEICKLWTEWFVLMLLLRLLFRWRGPLVWSLLALIGSGMAVVGGLWGVDDPGRGVPCLAVGAPLEFLRNYHSLFALAWIWVAWACMLWMVLRRDRSRWDLAGVLLVAPLAPVLGGLIRPDVFVRIAGAIGPVRLPESEGLALLLQHGALLAALLVPGIVAGLAFGWLLDRWPLWSGAALAVVCAVLAPWRLPSLTTIVLPAVAGALVVVTSYRDGRRRTALLVAGVLVVTSLAASAWWSVAALTWAVFVWAREFTGTTPDRRDAGLLALAVIQLAVLVGVTAVHGVPMVPAHPCGHDQMLRLTVGPPGDADARLDGGGEVGVELASARSAR